ncbi:hypothetical protein AGMMS49983_01390 [Clostridia bacterium]|nr:hypothetical protein AGMMS49983_01390 [Clostridia bacterium]
MFETEKVEKRIKDLVEKIGTDFLADEGVFRAVINDVLYDLKLVGTSERGSFPNGCSKIKNKKNRIGIESFSEVQIDELRALYLQRWNGEKISCILAIRNSICPD